MKLPIPSFVFLLLLVFLWGCPYSSSVPIDSPSIKVSPSFYGVWNSKTSANYTFTISAEGDKVYKILKKAKNANDESTYSAYLSDINGIKYLTIYEPNSAKKAYYFYKFVQNSADKITLTPVTENIDEKFTSSADLKAFFTKNQNNSYFWGKDEDVYTR